jgi:hypothetical protein
MLPQLSSLKKTKKFAQSSFVLESTTPNPAKKGLKYWCQDETRLGLKTIERKKITAVGVKPIGKVQWNFKAYYLYGAVAPQTGESFWLEFSHLDGHMFSNILRPVSI